MARETYLKINLDKLENNIKVIKERFNEYEYLIGVVKGNAYGHGMYIVNTLIEQGINYLAVSNLDEAQIIRKYNTDIPILCLEPIDLKYIDDIIYNNITLTISSLHYLKELIHQDYKKIKVHIKVDSGMNRLGFKTKKEFGEAVHLIKNNHLELEGIYTHMATTGVSDCHWDEQLANFKEIISDIDLKTIPMIHLSTSFSLMIHPKVDICNTARFGTIMYGYNVSPISSYSIKGILRTIRNKAKKRIKNISPTYENQLLPLESCISLYTHVMELKTIKPGEFVGYNASYVSKKEEIIAILPIGYEDGIGRDNKKRNVIINNQEYPIIGDIGMCMTSIKVDETIKLNDKVLLMGDGYNISHLMEATHHSLQELLISLSKALPKKYEKNNKIIFIDK